MNWVIFALSLHVLIAVLGIGMIGALPIAARSARLASLLPDALAVSVRPLLRAARISLFLAFASGAAVDFAFDGAFHRAAWFRLAGLLVVATALCLGRASVALTRALSGGLGAQVALRRIEFWGFTSALVVACIVVLMEWKPF